ncbi:SDR family oxidoreductase [Secundilactobacillus odoratitofui]|uniref:SDR family oxidoreductase n=1 Tax=Secundilactobacillus odoratitofui TaxID=480930 RepID=UPI000A8CC6CE|nr:NAD(P)H-binding protein [Secundilactobacillus odoratitofui]
MKITLLGSLGNINRIVVPRLIADGHDVTVISSSEKRIAAIEALGAHAAVGDMSDVTFLTEQFTGRDVVYLMISGSSPDLFGSAKQLGDIFKNAVMAAKVKKSRQS